MNTLKTLNFEQKKEEKPSSLWMITFNELRKNKFALAGLLIMVLLVLIAIFAPLFAPFDPFEMNLSMTLQPPNTEGHLLGTDTLGRDLLSRLIYGSRISLSVGLIVVSISSTLGVTLGAVSGYYGGLIDNIIMRLVDLLMAFPFLILVIAVVAIVGPSLTNMMIVLGTISWIGYARLVRGVVLSLKEKEFIAAARVVGTPDRRIIFYHILPNCMSVIIVKATFDVATAILAASGLSFLGMGAQPPTPEWGAMLSEGRDHIRYLPMMTIAPGVAIMTIVLAINFIGDALRDALDPRILKI